MARSKKEEQFREKHGHYPGQSGVKMNSKPRGHDAQQAAEQVKKDLKKKQGKKKKKAQKKKAKGKAKKQTKKSGASFVAIPQGIGLGGLTGGLIAMLGVFGTPRDAITAILVVGSAAIALATLYYCYRVSRHLPNTTTSS